MSQNGHPSYGLPRALRSRPLVVGNFTMSLGQRYEWHSHPVHQLAWTEQGVIAVGIGTKTWVLPPTRALWIPSGVVHDLEASRSAVVRNVYFRKRQCPIRWAEPTVVAITPLIRELVRHLALHPLERMPRQHAQRVLLDLLLTKEGAAGQQRPVTVLADVPLPTDVRARRVAEALLKNPADRRSLAMFGRRVAGASARTLARIFMAETGITFGEWRMQIRLRAALVHLADGEPVSVAAARVGYESPSAFVAAFRRQVGLPPGAYFSAGNLSQSL